MENRILYTGPVPDSIAPQFRAWLTDIGQRHSKTVEQVYVLWHNYAELCRNFDQSPAESEFLSWYKEELGNRSPTSEAG